MPKIFIPNPTQKKFIESRGEIDIFSARMGEGKTTAIIFSCFYHTLHNPGANWAIIRETWDDLRQTTLAEFLYWFAPFGHYYDSKKLFEWDSPLSGSVWFVPADDPGDARRLQSRPLGGFAIDEAAPVSFRGGVSETIFDIACGRTRQAGMKWYARKVACNNPDKTHWIYKRFVENGEIEGVNVYQSANKENEANLPPGYYDKLRAMWAHRPDLVKRYIEGEFAAIYEGDKVISVFDPERHVVTRNIPIRYDRTIYAFWDGGSTPCCLICQMNDDGVLYVVEEYYGQSMGVYELIHDNGLVGKYRNCPIEHVGDPSLTKMDQAHGRVFDVVNCAANTIVDLLGGTFTPGAKGIEERVEPLRIAINDGCIKISHKCTSLIDALYGAWCYNGTTGNPLKNHPYSDLGDALSYGASVLFAHKLRNYYIPSSHFGRKINYDDKKKVSDIYRARRKLQSR